MSGKVVLVGAGPSNLDLLTIGGKREILSAEVVVFDRLVSKDILDLIPKNAEKINVGKNVGHHPVKQSEINQILLEKALEGKHVVRLKGGDCFLFGRGGEELELLKEHGVDYKVISGISSSLSVPAYAGIPVTHRDFCSSLHIITGHKKADGKLEIDYDALVRLDGTLIFMMSVASSPMIMDGLLNAGMSSDMPAAIIENGTSSKQRKIVTSVGKLRDDIAVYTVKSPAIVMVGKVCELDFDWFTKQPLFGKKILVTRPRKNANKMVDALLESGADVTVASSIDIEPIEFDMPEIEKYDTIIFTSVNGVDAFFNKLHSVNEDARILFGKKIATIGSTTKKQLVKYGILSDFTPTIFDSTIFAKEMLESKFITEKSSILLVRGSLSSENLQNNLENIDFDEIICYNTQYVKENISNLQDFEIITFTSASAVTSFVQSHENYSHLLAFCIGEKTQNEALKYGFSTKVSKIATIEGLVDCIKEYYND